MAMEMPLEMDWINRQAWRAPGTLRLFAELEAYSDAGESVALRHVAEECRGQPILDVGVGAGRTIPLLRRISADYTAIDYTQEMVEQSRRRFPDARVLLGDARQLEFETGRFALVVFSFNGIDAVSHADRRAVLREAHRVLRPGGLYLFSTHNLDGPGFQEPLRFPRVRPTLDPVQLVERVGRSALSLARGIRNRRKFRHLNQRGEGYAVWNAGAHDFGIVVHYTTLSRQLEELKVEGFADDIVVFENANGRRIYPGGESAYNPWWFHLVARK
jgi:SAM-dependent methyltransferase